MNDEASIRSATPADAAAIGRVHAACLSETYTGLMPADWLAARTEEERTSQWETVLNQPAACGAIAVYLAERDGTICGFASCGWQRTELLKRSGFIGEFSAIYVLRSFQRRGVGLSLMHSLASALTETGINAAALWCLKDNADARKFYERIGGEFLIEQQGSEAHANCIEVAYGWRDIARLGK
ncbi:MAG TPA: GNAT family N-acetyltransferase [Rhizomicrobium sp.]|nr:GNAT family N-acetyltransferase [Rhizomicrobium sp.]